MSEKKIPMDSTKPVFMNVARTPDAAPRWAAGTAFMMLVVFGAAKSPLPIPFTNSRMANPT